MKNIHLDGRAFMDKETAHTVLKEKLDLPEYYGRNLDALWDCLTTDFTQKMITIQHPQAIKENLGRYGQLLLHVFEEIQERNDAITIVYAYDLKEKETEF